MNLWECLRVSLRALVSNKLRTALTMLGIIIGVGVVILVVAIGQGATKRVTEAVNSLGTNLLSIYSMRNRVQVGNAAARSSTSSATTTTSGQATPSQQKGLTMDDYRKIGTNFPQSVEAVAPQSDSNVQVRMGNVDSSTEI